MRDTRHVPLCSGVLWMRRLPRGSKEMLDRVGQVHAPDRDAGLSSARRSSPARRADERPRRQVLLVARLLADEHQHSRVLGPLTA